MPVQPDKIFEMYGGKVQIAYFDKMHRYSRIVDGVVQKDRIISVTAATGKLDKSRVLMAWATRLGREFLCEKLFTKDGKFRADMKKISEDTLMALIREAEKIYDVRREEAATIGTAVHKWAEEYIKGLNPDLPKDEKQLNGVMAFLKWVKEHDVEFILNEVPVYSLEHDYVGRMDVAVKMKVKGNGNKKLTCPGDFKTNNWGVDKITGERFSRVYDEFRFQIAAYRHAYEEEHGDFFTGPRLEFAFDKDSGDFAVHNLDEQPRAYEADFECFLGLLATKRREKELAKI